MAEKKHIQHLRSKVVENGKPKLPASDALMFGEIAVNYGKGVETLSIKNESGDVVTFSSDNALAFKKLANPSDSSKIGLVNSLSEYYDTNIGNGAVIEGDGTSTANITASGNYSHAEGYSTTANGNYSHAEGSETDATGEDSHAEGYNSNASGICSHAEGQSTTASGNRSHAEGSGAEASGDASHAEGYHTIASAEYSHAEGNATKASGYSSHAEGSSTTASGTYSHAEGLYTITNNYAEHASGRYNVSSSASITFGDSGNTLFSVGNGSGSSNRHNAFEIRQNGDIYIVKDNTDVKLQEVIPPVVELTNYVTSGSTLPTDDNTIYTYNGEVVEKRLGHTAGGDDIIAFATSRDVDGLQMDNISVLMYSKWDGESSYEYRGNFYLNTNTGDTTVQELRSIFGVHNATTTTDGLMSIGDKIKLGSINIVNNNFVITTGNAIVLSVGSTELTLDETNLLKLKNLLENS